MQSKYKTYWSLLTELIGPSLVQSKKGTQSQVELKGYDSKGTQPSINEETWWQVSYLTNWMSEVTISELL